MPEITVDPITLMNQQRGRSGLPELTSVETSLVNDQIASDATRQANIDAISAFYGSPERRQEIDQRIQPVFDRARQDLTETTQERARQEAFSRARSGNIGGSHEASELADLDAFLASNSMDLALQEQNERFNLEQMLQQQYQDEVLAQFYQNPFMAQALQAQMAGMGQQAQGAQYMDQLLRQQQDIEQFGSDEFSRALGQFLDIGGTAYRADMINQARGGGGIF